MKNKFIPYGHQWVDKKDIQAVVKVLKTDWITQGPKIDEFENKVAQFCGAKYGVAVSSGTAALHIAYGSAGLKKGDEVITTPLTFAATSNCLVFNGLKPVFADIKPDTLNIDPQEIEKKITKKTRALAPVDFAGRPCNYDKIFKIARKHKLLVIEDAAHALGSEYKGRKVGSFADMTILSFHPVKTITCGEGGMVLTNRQDLYEKLKMLRNHGMVKKPEVGAWYYEIGKPSFNFRITDLQCALGLSQLKKLKSFIKRRRKITALYNKAFRNVKEIIMPGKEKDVKSAWHLYVIQLCLEKLKADRKKIFEDLRAENIGVQIHYLPVHLHPFYKKQFGYKAGDFPKSENYYQRAVTLPLFPKMTDQQTLYVIETLKKIISKYRK